MNMKDGRLGRRAGRLPERSGGRGNGLRAAAVLLWFFASAACVTAGAAGDPPGAGSGSKGGGKEQAEPFDGREPRDEPGAEDRADPELIDPGPDGCPLNERTLELLV